ncbi:hypothetical protein QYF36_012708 [Acer negundo]|nr:hypothetical protein QYF36_012708 [Acer negundo]
MRLLLIGIIIINYSILCLQFWISDEKALTQQTFLMPKLCFNASKSLFWVRSLGRNTRGSVAMRLKEGDKVACMDIIPAAIRKGLEGVSKDPQSNVKGSNGPWLLFVSESGYGKRVPLSSFRQLPLKRVGLIGYKFASEDRLAAVFVVDDAESDEQLVLVSQSGTVNRIKVRDISIQSRYARGVILMRLEYAGKIQSASLISATEPELDEQEPGNVSLAA